MNFLDGVNRILRSSALIRGDTDLVATFNDTAHNASLNVAIIAVQNELVKLVADRLISKERRTTGSITFSTNTRTYDLATGFTRFFATPYFYRAAENRQIYEYSGGVEKLQTDIYNYQTQYGPPNWWYWEPGNTTNKQVGFFMVPSSTENGKVWTYDYQTSVIVTASSDELPFHNNEESFSFVEMAARRFKFMFEDVKNEADIQGILDKDTSYRSAKATLYKLLKGVNPPSFWGKYYA